MSLDGPSPAAWQVGMHWGCPGRQLEKRGEAHWPPSLGPWGWVGALGLSVPRRLPETQAALPSPREDSPPCRPRSQAVAELEPPCSPRCPCDLAARPSPGVPSFQKGHPAQSAEA